MQAGRPSHIGAMEAGPLKLFLLLSVFALLFLASMILINGSVTLLVQTAAWMDCVVPSRPAITYRQFRAMYAINPGKWRQAKEDCCMVYKGMEVDFKTACDYLQYSWFAWHVRRRKEKAEYVKNQARLIKEVQGDVNRQYREAGRIANKLRPILGRNIGSAIHHKNF